LDFILDPGIRIAVSFGEETAEGVAIHLKGGSAVSGIYEREASLNEGVKMPVRVSNPQDTAGQRPSL